MRKKLILILTTILLAVTTFTSNVFGDDFTTSGQIFNTVTNYTLWTNQYGKAMMEIVGPDIDTQPVIKAYNYLEHYKFSWSSYDFLLFTDGTKLLSINIEDSNGIYSGTYRNRNEKTIGSILPSDFPCVDHSTVPETYPGVWMNENDIGVIADYAYDLIRLYNYGNSFELSTTLTPDGNGNYYIIHADTGGKFTFYMNGNTLTKIVGSNFPPVYDADKINGTFLPPAPVTTISDILQADFPNDGDKGLVNANGLKAYISQSSPVNLMVGSLSIPVTNPVVQEGNNYSYTMTIPANCKILFNMSNGKVSTITVSNSGGDEDGTFETYKFKHESIVKPIGYQGDIEFTTNAKYIAGTDIDVIIDGSSIMSDRGTKYDVRSGSTIITLLSDYVKTLASGEHTITVKYAGYSELTQKFYFANTPSGGGSSGHVVLNTGVSSFLENE